MYKKWFFSVVLALFTVVPSMAAASFDHNLYYGLINDSDVMTLQTFLTEQGVYTGLVNGNFFSQTKKAVIDFQTQENILPAHGYFGRKTRIAANAILDKQDPSIPATVSGVTSSTTSVSPDEVKSFPSKSTEPTLDTVVAELVQDEVALHDLSTKFDTLNDEMSSVSSAVDALNAQIAMLQSALTVFTVTGYPSTSVSDPMPLPASPSTSSSASGAPSATSTLRLSTSTLSSYMLLHATSTKLVPVLLHAPVSKPTLAPTTKVVVPAPKRQ